MVKVGLLGFGKAGRAVAEVLLNESSVSLEWVYKKSKSEFQSVKDYSGICCEDPAYIFSEKQIDIEKLISSFPVDVIVDFSNSSAIFTYADSVKSRNISLISAISSYPDKCLVVLKEISKRTRVIYSPNITLGINFLLLMSKMLKSIAPDADIEIIEEHFSLKKEVSGTAKVLARSLQLPASQIKTIRAGGIVGVHEVLFGFPYQTIRLRHEAISKEAFGNGIVFAIHHLPKSTHGFFSMQDLLKPMFAQYLDEMLACA